MTTARIPAGSGQDWSRTLAQEPGPLDLGLWLRAAGIALILAVSFFLAYRRLMAALVLEWSTSRMYSYGFLIPLVSAYLIWLRRKDILTADIRPCYFLGIPLLLGSSFVLLIGQAGNVISLEAPSIVLALGGMVLLVWGRSVFACVFLGIAYLPLMLPIWEIVTSRIHFPFQLLAAKVGTGILQGIGIAAVRDGTSVILSNVTLEVAEECSGVNYLIAVLAVGIPVAHFFMVGFFRRALVVSFAVLIAALANGLRVGLIGVFSYWEIGSALHGPLHILQGVFVSLIGYLVLFLGVLVFSNRKDCPEACGTGRAGGPPVAQTRGRTSLFAISLATSILGLTWLAGLREASGVPLSAPLASIPLDLAEWRGTDSSPAAFPHRSKGADMELLRRYRSEGGAILEAYVAYFAAQREGKELGNASSMKEGTEVELRLGDREFLSARKSMDMQGPQKSLLLWFYWVNGETICKDSRVKLSTVWNVIANQRSDACLVLVSVKTPDYASEPRLLEDASRFLRGFLPALRACLPGK